MEFFFGTVFPYVAFGVFLTGTVLRVGGWLRTPVPFQLTLFPAPANAAGKVMAIIKEFLLCGSLYRENRLLWFPVWLFHLSLALIIAGHVLGIRFLRGQFTLIGLSPESSRLLSLVLGGVTGLVMTLSLVALIWRRCVDPEVKRLSEPSNYFDPALLLGVALTGILMYIPEFHVDLQAVRTYMGGLLGMNPAPLPLNAVFVTHFLLVNVLLLYFPFSSLLHSAGFFVIKTILVEAPPVYPTPEGIARRSAFASKKLRPDIPVPGQASIPLEDDGR